MPLLRRLLLLLFAVGGLPAWAADDLHGDPLPPGALVRLGTIRFRRLGEMGFTPDGQALVATGDGYSLSVWDARTGRLVREISTGKFYIRGFALSPDGKVAAVSGNTYEKDGKGEVEGIRFIEVATGKVLRTLPRTGSYGSVLFSPDGKFIASVVEGTVRIEEVETGTELIKERFKGNLQFLDFTGGLLAVAGYNTPVWLWDWQSGKPPREIKMPPRGANSVSLSPDGALLATGDDEGGCVHLWDVASGKRKMTLRASDRDAYARAAFSPDGRILASTSYQYRGVILWDPVTGKEIRRIPMDQRYTALPVWSRDSRRFAVRSGAGVRVYDTRSGKEAVKLPEGHWASPSIVTLLADGTAMTASDDGTVRLWDSATGKLRRTLRGSAEWIRGAAISPDGKWIATSSLDPNSVSLWEAGTGRVVYRLPGHGQMGGRRLVAFTPDGKRVLSWGDDLFLRGWELRNGKAFIEHELRPDGEKAPDPDTVRDDFEGRINLFGAGTFTRDAGRFVMACHDGTFVFDTATGKQVLKIKTEPGSPRYVAVSPDGKRLLTGMLGPSRQIPLPDGRTRFSSGDGVITLHDLTTGKLVREQKLPERFAGPVAFSPDGKSFAASCYDRVSRVTFHDTSTGAPQGEIDRLPGRVASLAFSPDGKRVIVGCGDTTALIYPVPAKEKPR